MTKITIHKKPFGCSLIESDYTIDIDRKFGGYQAGDLICYINPFFGIPLKLEIAIRIDGSIIFRSWAWTRGNGYLHTHEKPVGEETLNPFVPTQEQIDTVNGLFSGRIKFEGLALPVGATVQKICPIDVKREEELTGRRIYLA